MDMLNIRLAAPGQAPAETGTAPTGETEQTTEQTAPEETRAVPELGKLFPGKSTEAAETTETVAQPDPQPEAGGSALNFLMIGVGVLALVLAAAVLLKLFSRKKKPARSHRAPAGTGVRIDTAVLHEIGARKDQQDSWGLFPREQGAQDGILAIMADGMGGLANGSLVSQGLVKILSDEFLQSSRDADPGDVLLGGAAVANQELTRILEGSKRSGSTLVAAIVQDGRLYYLTAGDSRIYLMRKGGLIQLNSPHIYREMLAVQTVNRQASLEQVRSDPQTGSLTSYFGSGTVKQVDRNPEGIRLINGDRILLMSDGVFGTLSEAQMEEALRQPLPQAADLLREGVEAAALSYQDNYTAVMLEYRTDSQS